MKKKDLSISMLAANILSLVFIIPIGVAIVWGYILRWGLAHFNQAIDTFFGNILVFVLVFVGGIIAHELIHGLAWALVARRPFSAVKFGFQIQTLTPYAHCKEPMPVASYRAGTWMPGLLLGLLPALVGIIGGSGWFLMFGLIFTAAAGGDMVILWTLRKVNSSLFVEDHPNRAGCFVLEK